ncbi:MAG: dual specificity protein phosphatase family protein [Planctomycetes bacterium]|nr:dual specificity protein phosphatase family protein [Planctomycetota bacterium]
MRRRQTWSAAIGCSALFLLVYGLTNARAAAATDLDSWHFDWEESIPFVPWMIVPYVSIDLFFVAAPFVCTSRREVATLAKRLCAAILTAGLVFLIWPLQLGFDRPQAVGMFAPLYGALHGFDQPHNLFPSLHVTLIFILRWTYHRHVRGLTRGLLHVWFALVTASTVLTRQHHLPDLLGGLVLALLVFYVFPTGLIRRRDVRVERAPSRRLALRFLAAASVALLGAAIFLVTDLPGRWLPAAMLGWTALAFAIVAVGYGRLGPLVFRKYAGYLSLPARAVLAPYLLGLWLSRRRFWRRDPRPFAIIMDEVMFGRLPDRRLLAELKSLGVGAIVDLTAEHSAVPAARALDYTCVPMMDLAPPQPRDVRTAVGQVERALAAGLGVYLHCGLGYQRSAIVIACWLLETERATTTRAAALRVASARPMGLSADHLARELDALTASPSRGDRENVDSM